MGNMLIMNQRMTQRANYHQVFCFIVVPISIFMVNAQHFFHLFISAFYATFYHISSQHCFSDSRIFGRKSFHFTFIYAFPPAIFSFSRKTIIKISSTMKAFKGCVSSFYLRPMIAFSRTIFGFICPTRSMEKFFFANPTYCFYFFSFKKPLTSQGTVFSCIHPIVFNIKNFFTKQTNFRYMCH